MDKKIWVLSIFLLAVLFGLFFLFPGVFGSVVSYSKDGLSANVEQTEAEQSIVVVPPLDIVAYDKKLEEIANNPPPKVVVPKKDKDGNEIPVPPTPPPAYLWPVKTAYPNDGALLPFNRIIAYYGNLYSTKMGVLGEYPEDVMLAKLAGEVKKWEIADPGTPVIPALHYIAVVAQGSAGKDGKYRARMPDSEIDKVLAIAAKINGIVFLDLQVGFSTVETEIPLLEKYLKLPNVHLALDPEFSMKGTIRPGKVVGTLDATDINFASNYLAKLVKENHLTPKILMVHRYTQKMVTNYKQIKTMPEVQIIMNMDGWGGQAKKIGTYKNFIYSEPVQFTGFKLFYKNDLWDKGTVMMTPETLLKLNPRPVYIQFQ
ncbi:MAG: hypothetical protein WC609_02795 [Candidatus Paceibacterota bacterium]|jgi:hypothetical protein